jgi:ATP-dependent DNA helicase RecQ
MLTTSQDLIVLTSPPASGKTYWIHSLCKAMKPKGILVISPLRALADECRGRWDDEITVMTPEEWLGKKVFYEIVIFDEFHLFFYWGDSFRPLMWEVFFEISLMTKMTFVLTATLSSQMRQEVSLFSTQFDHILWLNHGNQYLLYKPSLYLKAPSKKWIMNEIESQVKGADVKLIFCKYRNEVLFLEKKLTELGYSCLSCVGGESKFMAEKLKHNPCPDFIVATTVLSHGVNLPDIKKIFFLYEVANLDFWIQMVARGGRRGESFEVYSLEKPWGLIWNPWQNLIHIMRFSLKRKLSHQSFPFF